MPSKLPEMLQINGHLFGGAEAEDIERIGDVDNISGFPGLDDTICSMQR